MNATNINTRIDAELKADATNILGACGLTMSTAIRIFLEQVVQTQGLPFDVKRTPSAKTARALKEANELEKTGSHRFDSINGMVEDMTSDK
ncbi:type II toxin-antitoxin system RelB/DinJ family antitoxin [Zophobihabitans entericus]|nr:type II toxin-antitoxin system RelB/DinJ family antitoxin [Zophobihabitans entericus]